MQRMTKQRMAILKCLSESERPLSVEEIFLKASIEIPQINLSTVYRTIKLLLQERKVALIDLPGDRSCYEIASKEHHHYFLCDSCNKTYSINKCPRGLSEIFPQGFSVLSHSITLNGFCAECNN
ncbi:MAG: Fur family transcriptional regulator [Chlamydiales bacterium]